MLYKEFILPKTVFLRLNMNFSIAKNRNEITTFRFPNPFLFGNLSQGGFQNPWQICMSLNLLAALAKKFYSLRKHLLSDRR